MDNYEIQQTLQGELLPGETLLWSGKPSRRVFIHKEDGLLIPFSLLWGGFAIFWEFGAIGGFGNSGGGNWLFEVWGVPFVLIGQYMIWGRFVHAWWKKKRIFYGVTPKRVIVLDRAWGKSVKTAYVDQIPGIHKDLRSNGIGTLRFGDPPPQTGRRKNLGSFDPLATSGVLSFVDIENAESVCLIVAEAREKLTATATRQF